MADAPAIVQDGVQCEPPSGIDVLIIGAGVGGLTAALECHRKGHTVRVIERAPNATAAGTWETIPSGITSSNHAFQATNSQSAFLDAVGSRTIPA